MIYDCLIVGGGAAGLSVALGLGRVNRSCVVFSHQNHRNKDAKHIHAVLSRDHIDPNSFYHLSRQQIARYQNTNFVEAEIVDVARTAEVLSNFVARDAEGRSWQGRSIVLATGVHDLLPDLEGYVENWPANIYQCLFCDGYERRELPKGVLCYPSFNPMMAKMATMLHCMSPPRVERDQPATERSSQPKVTVFTNGPPNVHCDPKIQKALDTCAAHRMLIDTRPVVKLVADTEKEGVYVHVRNEDGSQSAVHMAFLFHKPSTAPAAPRLLSQLGVELSPTATVALARPPFQSTNIPGVFVAGDTCTEMTHATNAMYTGMMCAAGVTHYCNDLDDQTALASS
ncbi:uncharacterized protein Z519_07089 [Cladophialophora bantiana CBS 173.52]|uniref:FAD/NAD(P)-binding domain-containing protein n=1 Tax=Cladophialophora bantiana (strain ATCC 10958 / CBS 173.52 / CDC B-1940 / NIH 8579) TaxID=1442370 RepID=A0A0D2HMU6_CLAB1|nr:uncharacterized protein Z519_07089 [Cladophialophora bantiana CBS 173.52]KIW92105.1 hypothetical protein Z519_07089 [Cladophialophora bantiana CBS 173.52]